MANLGFFEFFSIISSLVFIIVSTIVGIKIILNFFKTNKYVFILIGLAWIGISAWAYSLVYLYVVILILSSEASPMIFLFIDVGLYPIALLFWVFAMRNLFHNKILKSKFFVVIFILFVIFLEILFFYYAFNNITMIGHFNYEFNMEFGPIAIIIYAVSLSIFLGTGLPFVYISIKSEIRKVRIKGIFLLIAFIMFTVAALIAFLIPTKFSEIIAQIFFILSAMFYYLGFILPKKVENLLLNKKGRT